MPKWKKDAKAFTVGVNYNETRGYQTSIPKPIIDHIGAGKEVKAITYLLRGSGWR